LNKDEVDWCISKLSTDNSGPPLSIPLDCWELLYDCDLLLDNKDGGFGVR